MVLVHTEVLTLSSIREMSTKLLSDTDEWGKPRDGDGSFDGAGMRHEISAALLDHAVVLLDSRTVTHRALRHAFLERQVAAGLLNRKEAAAMLSRRSKFKPSSLVHFPRTGPCTLQAVRASLGARETPGSLRKKLQEMYESSDWKPTEDTGHEEARDWIPSRVVVKESMRGEFTFTVRFALLCSFLINERAYAKMCCCCVR